MKKIEKRILCPFCLLFTRSVMLISAGMQNCNSHVIGRVCPSFGVLTVTFTAQESMAVFVWNYFLWVISHFKDLKVYIFCNRKKTPVHLKLRDRVLYQLKDGKLEWIVVLLVDVSPDCCTVRELQNPNACSTKCLGFYQRRWSHWVVCMMYHLTVMIDQGGHSLETRSSGIKSHGAQWGLLKLPNVGGTFS